ncbi:hypothetical protein [Pseudodesulfovibrio senegalensis]|uniref:hypothetical protein n=1 Tax=Pseudodesulfovibrio senegalensis TaxID=1721087 RepID=UPI0013763BB2|nr:hypothetical protein [Pseudodesulfovibrio senegalensis]
MIRFKFFMIALIAIFGLSACGGPKGVRDNPSKLNPSPCAGCFSHGEKIKLGIEEHDS